MLSALHTSLENILMKICTTDTNESRLYQHLSVTARWHFDIILDLNVLLSVIPSCTHIEPVKCLKSF